MKADTLSPGLSSGSIARSLAGFSLSISLLVTALWLGWQLLVPLDFGYSIAYRLLDIGEHVQTFGPENRYKPDFELTTAREQKRLFGDIVRAIQHSGAGLREISYTTTGGQRHALLREAEAIHLQDVANLIDFFYRVAWACLALLLITLALMHWRRLPPPGGKQILLGLAGLLAAVGLVLLVAGPTNTFYWLHTQIFPENHEWFFYYQDSLMTTLMKAPDLFGFIAALWGLVSLMMLIAGYWFIHRWLRSRWLPSRRRSLG